MSSRTSCARWRAWAGYFQRALQPHNVLFPEKTHAKDDCETAADYRAVCVIWYKLQQTLQCRAVFAHLAEGFMYEAHARSHVFNVSMVLSKSFSELPNILECVLSGIFGAETRVFFPFPRHMLAEILQCDLEELLPVLRLLEVVPSVMSLVYQAIFFKYKSAHRT